MTFVLTILTWCARLVACAQFAVLAALGCAIGTQTDDATYVTGAEIAISETAPGPSPTADPSPAGEVRYLRYPVSVCGPADPAVGQGRFEHPISGEIHAGLTRFKDFPTPGFELELASGYSTDDSGAVYVFTLRPDLKFSDGSSILASDFVWSWNRAVGKARHGSIASTVFEPILGFEDAIGSRDTEMEGLRAVDDQTLEVRLARAVPNFPLMIANPVAAVLKPDNALLWDETWSNAGIIQETRFDGTNMPVGAGPFRLSEYSLLLDGCIIEINPHYGGSGGRPMVGRVGFIPTDPDEVESAFRSGEIDVATGLYAGFHDVDEALPVRIGAPEYLLLNPGLAPLDSLQFRKALMHATPVFALGEDGDDFQRLLPLELAFGASMIGRLAFDEEMARDEIEKCNCLDDGRVRNLTHHSELITEGLTPLGWMFREWDRVLGVTVDQSMADRAEIVTGAQAGTLDLMSYDVNLAYPHPAAALGQLLEAIPGGDRSEIVSELLRLTRLANSELDSERQSESLLAIEQRILDYGLAIPVLSPGTEFARVKPWVHGLGPVWPGASHFRDVRVLDRP